ncbi:hypothetical protein V5799_013729 [Amblyomma americanum]|uniref:Glycosyl hydrolase family 31 C-terminal domain-containing protein n=1 Tax=Amblyomma americanum TaxID=6943 RepID=A0AAQ4E522_AMBAM
MSYYLPAGLWYDYYDNAPFLSSGEYMVHNWLRLDTPTPLYVRAGSILATQTPGLSTRDRARGLIPDSVSAGPRVQQVLVQVGRQAEAAVACRHDSAGCFQGRAGTEERAQGLIGPAGGAGWRAGSATVVQDFRLLLEFLETTGLASHL